MRSPPARVMGMLSSVPREEQAGVKKDDGAQCGWSPWAALPAILNNPVHCQEILKQFSSGDLKAQEVLQGWE